MYLSSCCFRRSSYSCNNVLQTIGGRRRRTRRNKKNCSSSPFSQTMSLLTLLLSGCSIICSNLHAVSAVTPVRKDHMYNVDKLQTDPVKGGDDDDHTKNDVDLEDDIIVWDAVVVGHNGERKSYVSKNDRSMIAVPQQQQPMTARQDRNLIISDFCTDVPLASLFKPSDVTNEVLDWFGIEGNGVTNIVNEVIDTYFTEEYDIATGKEIRESHRNRPDSDELRFDEVCERLPLKDDECYLGQDTRNLFIERLVAQYVPFGAELVEAKRVYDNFVDDVGDSISELEEYFSANIEFFDKGSCAVINTEMIGINEYPGLPPPLVYKVCNCVSMVTTGAPACTVQPYFRGIAFSIGGSKALRFDTTRLGPFPEESIKFFDGYVEYSLQVDFDLWLDFGLDMKIPKIFPGGAGQDLICSPAEAAPGAEKKTEVKFPEVRSKISMFIKSDVSNDGEFFAVIAIDSFRLVFASIFELDMGSAYGALRVRSENPGCAPSGIFFGGLIQPQFTFGDELKEFLSLPTLTLDVKAGFTWLDDGSAESAGDYVQSVFFRAETEFNFLGITSRAMFEVQYFDDKEFIRRRDFDENVCCTGEQTNCNIPNSALETFIQRDDITAQPTLALFMGIEDMVFAFGLIKFESIEGEFIIQIASDDFAMRVRLFADVKVLFIVGVRLEVIFEISEGGDNWLASFEAELEVNIGLGTLITGVRASAAVGDFTQSGRALQEESATSSVITRSSTSSFLDADWNLNFYADWETAQWLEDLGKAIVEGLKFLYEGLKLVWEGLKQAVEAAWNVIKNIAAAIGGAIADFFGGISDGLDKLGQGLEDGIDAIESFFDGTNLGAVGDIIGAVGGGVVNIIGAASDAFGAVEALFSGDFESAGQLVLDVLASPFYGTSNFSVENLNKRDEYLNCPVFRNTWEECWRVLFIGVDCTRKYSKEYIKDDCRERKLQLYEDLKNEQADAKRKLDCRRDNEETSQGLKFAGDADDEDLQEGLDVSMGETNFNIGKISELGNGDGCKPMPFSVQVQTLASTVPGFSGSKSNASGTSRTCFGDQTQLETSLVQLKSNVADSAKDAATQSQGANDENFKTCSGTEDCTIPELVPQENFRQAAGVFCTQDMSRIDYRGLFGDVLPVIADRCAPRVPRFRVDSSLPPLSCDTVDLRIKRSIRDCCGKEASIFQTLQVVPVPPTITQAPGSMDKTLLCDANISPFVLGFPSYEEGCPNAFIERKFEDSNPIFDSSTCTTTITRTLRIVENGCDRLAQSFVQTILLQNPYNPEWDFFPDDTTIGVFDEYGTEVLGFPTAFQKCGASPVHVTYSDTIEEGRCFAERILKRKFKAVDVCGHVSERTQTITITNDNELPLGEKSLAKIYGRDKAYVDIPGDDGSSGKDKTCLVSSFDCDIRAPVLPLVPVKSSKGKNTASSTYQCGTGSEEEFSPYQSRLAKLKPSLDKGPTKKSCSCQYNDLQCDSRLSNDQVYYGTPVTFASGICLTEELMQPGTNRGTTRVVREQKTMLPSKGKGSREPSIINVERKILTGTDTVYNLFEILASDFNKTIEINAPPTSVVLVNVHWEDTSKPKKSKYGKGKNGKSTKATMGPSEYDKPSMSPSPSAAPSEKPPPYRDQNIKIDEIKTDGIVLSNDDMVANNILWNVIGNGKVNFKVPGDVNPWWSFDGTMINSRGKMELGKGKGKYRAPIVWKGQLFSNYIKADNVDFQCAHFTGFASCKDVGLPSNAPSDVPSPSSSDPDLIFSLSESAGFTQRVCLHFLGLVLGFFMFD